MKSILAIFATFFALEVMAQLPPHMRCELPRSESCESFVNSNLHRWDQRDQIVQRQLQNACAGNLDKECVAQSAKHMAWYDLNDAHTMIRVARSCQLSEISCVDYVVSKLSRIEYNEVSEITEVNRACARSEGSCVKQACESGQYNCRRKPDLLRAAKACFKPCWPR